MLASGFQISALFPCGHTRRAFQLQELCELELPPAWFGDMLWELNYSTFHSRYTYMGINTNQYKRRGKTLWKSKPELSARSSRLHFRLSPCN